MNNCLTCRAYSALEKECRANPPEPALIMNQQGQPIVLGMFPSTKPENWCCAWKDKE